MAYIYVCNPYTHISEDKEHSHQIMQDRFEQAEAYTAQLLLEGHVVFSPIMHCHELAKKYDLPPDFGFWQNYCLSMLAPATEMHVVQLDGWDKSSGVAGEMQFCIDNNIEVKFIKPSEITLKSD